jgi:hypothetical protein
VIKYLIIFALILAYRLVVNLVRRKKCASFLNLYLEGGNDWNFGMQQDEIVELFRKAGIEDNHVPYAQPVGYGKVASGMVSVFQNLSSHREDIVHIVLTMFHRALGVYSKRAKETFNPLFWVEYILYLPKNVLQYFGLPPDHVFVRTVQIIYWAISAIASFFNIFSQPEMMSFFRTIFSSSVG